MSFDYIRIYPPLYFHNMDKLEIFVTLIVLLDSFMQVNCAEPDPFLRAHKQSSLTVEITGNGKFDIKNGNEVWFSSGPTFVRKNGRKYQSDENMKWMKTIFGGGQDELGPYTFSKFRYSYDQNIVDFSIREYKSEKTPAIVFEQFFHNDSSNTAAKSFDDIISAFPTFDIGGTEANLGFLSFGGNMIGDSDKKFGRWRRRDIKINTGISGGPIILFNDKAQPFTVILSPFSEFMAASVAHDPVNGSVSWGLMGGIESIPADTSYKTILYYGSKGINKTLGDWGQMMRFYYRKDDYFRMSDLTLNYIGYWTDRGAYYYYETEPSKTYEQTILDIWKDANAHKIPYRYMQYDSWFYSKGPQGGVNTWEPMRDLFPNGFQYVYNLTGWPAAAHNRWWSSTTTYAFQNGGKFQFIISDPPKAIPTEEAFWEYLFNSAKKWGLILYEQDWLDYEFYQNATLKDLKLGRTWLTEMGEAAANNDLRIQYCMSNPRHVLQSLEISVVTQARVSGDYIPGNEQWRVGISSMLADALGIAPFKDNFWTTKNQPGNKYGTHEPYSALQSLVATLSTGPVGPSDKISLTNVSLLMRCCNEDGLILKPSRPAVAIDKQIMEAAFNASQNSSGEIWSTYTTISGHRFGIMFAADQINPISINNRDIGFDVASVLVFSSVLGRSEGNKIRNVSEITPMTLSNCTKGDFCLYYTSTVFKVGKKNILIYGEENKWVPMSQQRVLRIDNLENDIIITIKGRVNETIGFRFIDFKPKSSEIKTVSCTFGPSGFATIKYRPSKCQTQ